LLLIVLLSFHAALLPPLQLSYTWANFWWASADVQHFDWSIPQCNIFSGQFSKQYFVAILHQFSLGSSRSIAMAMKHENWKYKALNISKCTNPSATRRITSRITNGINRHKWLNHNNKNQLRHYHITIQTNPAVWTSLLTSHMSSVWDASTGPDKAKVVVES